MSRLIASWIRTVYAFSDGNAALLGALWCIGNLLVFVMLRHALRALRGGWLVAMALPLSALVVALSLLGGLLLAVATRGRPSVSSLAVGMLIEASVIAVMTWLLLTHRAIQRPTSHGSLARLPYLAALVMRPLIVAGFVVLLFVSTAHVQSPSVAIAITAGILLTDQLVASILVRAYRAHGETVAELSATDPYLAETDVVVVDGDELVQPAAMFGYVLPGAIVVVRRWVATAALDPAARDHAVALAILFHEGAHIRGRHAQWRAVLIGASFFAVMAYVPTPAPWLSAALAGASALLAAAVMTHLGELTANNRIQRVFGEATLRRMRDIVRSSVDRDGEPERAA